MLAPDPSIEAARNAAASGVVAPDADWVYARDGALTTRPEGRWLGGVSVPKRSAELLVRNLTAKGRCAVLVRPTHPQQVRAVLDKLDAKLAVIVILSAETELSLTLALVDFSGDLAAGRLHFAWDAFSLKALFDRHPGLAVPQQFLRLPVTDDADATATIAWGQTTLGDVASDHRRRLAASLADWRAGETVCVVAPQSFALWNDAGRFVGGFSDIESVNTDAPLSAAVAFAAERCRNAKAVLMPDAGRSDWLADAAPPDRPWLTYVTRPRVPAFVAASPRDALLLADEVFRPLATGWPADRVAVVGWPVVTPAGPERKTLAIVADLPDLAPPKEVEDFSSWRVTWETIAADLVANPHRLGESPAAYLDRVRQQTGVAKAGFPAGLFLDGCVAPAYLLGIAKWLKREGLPLELFGRGWAVHAGLAGCCRGVLDTPAALAVAVSTAGVIDPFLTAAHPVRGLRARVVRTPGRTPTRLLQDARAALAGTSSMATPSNTIKTTIARLLQRGVGVSPT